MAPEVSAFGTQRRVGGGVGTGFGEDVAPIAERVSPGPEAQGFVFREAAEAPAGAHEGADVCADGRPGDVGPGGERVIEAGAGFTGSFGDVLGDVRGYGVVIRAVAICVQWPGVDLVTPAQDQPTHGGGVGCVDVDASGGGAYGVGEEVCGGPGWRLVVGSGRTVEAYDGMDVDGRPLLVLGDAGEGEPGMLGEARLYEASRGGEAPPDVDDESVPQLGCVRVPEDVAGVVVALGTQRLAGDRHVRGMDGSAAERTAVLAGAAAAARSADFPSPVDDSEGRGSQSDEEPRPVADRRGNVLAAEETRADEMEGVPGMEAGAGRADGCAAVAAADEEAFAGFVASVVVAEDLAGRAVEGGGGAGEVDGVSAAAGGGDLLQPAGELGVLGEA